MINDVLHDDDVLTAKRFQPPRFINGVPEGYMTGDEFERRVMYGLKKRLIENGYLQ